MTRHDQQVFVLKRNHGSSLALSPRLGNQREKNLASEFKVY
jgi:hypothetical protein